MTTDTATATCQHCLMSAIDADMRARHGMPARKRSVPDRSSTEEVLRQIAGFLATRCDVPCDPLLTERAGRATPLPESQCRLCAGYGARGAYGWIYAHRAWCPQYVVDDDDPEWVLHLHLWWERALRCARCGVRLPP